jgi:hypothetical protein
MSAEPKRAEGRGPVGDDGLLRGREGDLPGADRGDEGAPWTSDPFPREPHAFQQSITADDFQAIGQNLRGAARITSAVELGGGMYNNTFRITADGLDQPVILHVAPAPERQFASEY